jgi:glycosyltransferase involved in cell wall biosynthesis
MGYARPVVVNGIPENLATVGEAGLSFPPGDVGALRKILAEILDDREALDALGEKSVQRVRTHYNWERIADEFQALFQDLVEGREPRTDLD